MNTIPHLRLLTEEIREYERSGKYRAGFEALSGYWNDFHKAPDTSGLSTRDRGELLLRCGVLAGFLGRSEKSDFAQDNSKNLLTEARDIFLSLDLEELLVEAENAIALAYLRKGEFRESEIWIECSLNRDLSPDHFARVQSFLVKSLYLLETKRFKDAHDFLVTVESYFRDFDDDYLNGCFAANLGLALKSLGRLPDAMQMYSLARHYHLRSGNLVLLATISNNMSNLYRVEGRFDLAHQAIDNAIELYEEAGDISRSGFAFDTKALIFLDEANLCDAEICINKGLDILRQTEFEDFLAESLMTKIKILIAGDNLSSAAITFSEAAEIVSRIQGQVRLEALAEEFEALVRGERGEGLSRVLTEKVITRENYELELAPSLAGYSSFDLFWIRNQHFENLGLEIGSLALVVEEKVVAGDLVALREHGSEEVVCGYLEKEPGKVLISNCGSDRQIFDGEAVEIMGRVVGYAKPAEMENGTLKVEPLVED